MKKIRTRLLSLLLVLVTVLSLLPTSALAASSTGTGIKPTSNTNYWTTRLLHDGTPYSYKPPMAVPCETPTPIAWYLVLSIFFRCAALFFHASTAKDGSEESRICHSPIK